MSQREDLEKLARQMRKDVTAIQVNLGELLRAIAALPATADEVAKTHPAVKVERMIRNGSLVEPVALEAEIAGYLLAEREAEQLRALHADLVGVAAVDPEPEP